MKLASNITCIIAIFIQIFLSSVAFAHDFTCQYSASSFTSPSDSQETSFQHAKSCKNCHDHTTKTVSYSHRDLPEIVLSNSPVPCTCSSIPVLVLISSDFSVVPKERKVTIAPITLNYKGLPFLIIPGVPSLTGVLASSDDSIGLKDRLKLVHIPQYSGHFVSTYLSKFLL